jgi:uncharacterized protein YjbJ (UPF0337 family)
MDKNRVIGAGKVVAGKIQEAAGHVVGDAKLRADGKAKQVEGHIQNAVGGIKDAAKDAVKTK